jgi:hypothetical protein
MVLRSARCDGPGKEKMVPFPGLVTRKAPRLRNVNLAAGRRKTWYFIACRSANQATFWLGTAQRYRLH